MKSETKKVEVGQVWEDNDPRYEVKRTLTVMAIDGDYVECLNSPSGRVTKIKIKRLRPNSTGYRLIKEANDERRD